MGSGGLCVMTPLAKLKLMWLVNSWDLIQLLDMETWIPWGIIKSYNNYCEHASLHAAVIKSIVSQYKGYF